MPKEVKRNLKVYSENDIHIWLQKLRELPVEIETVKAEKQNLSLQKEQIIAQLNTLVEHDLKPIQLTIKKINAQIDALQLPLKIAKLESGLPGLKEQLDAKEEIYNKVNNEKLSIDKEVADLNALISIKVTEEQLGRCELNISDLKNKQFKLEQEQRHNAEEILRVDQKYSNLSLQIRAVEDQIQNARYYTSSSNGEYYSSQTTNEGGYTSSQTPNHGYISSSNQYISSGNYQNLQRQLEILQQQRRQLSEQRSGIYSLRDSVERQLSSVEKSLRQENNNKKDYERKLSQFTHQQKLHAEATALESLKMKLSHGITTQEEIETRYGIAKNDFNAFKGKYNHLRNQISNLKSHLSDALNLRGEFETNDNLEDLQIQLEKQNQLKAPLERKESELEMQIRNLSDQLNSNQRQLKKLEDELQQEQENTFLQDFTNRPGKLYDKLSEQIVKKLDQFDREKPINQSRSTRIAIAEIRAKLEMIDKQVPFQNSQYQSYLAHQIDLNKNKYIETCGLLQAQLEKLEDDKDLALRETLENILQENALEKNYALTHYFSLGYNRYTDKEYDFFEKQQYQQTLTHFKDSIKRLQEGIKNPDILSSDGDKNMLRVSQELIKKIEEHEAAPKKGETFDYKYYTTLINAAEKLAYDPKNLDNQRNFHSIIQHVDNGKPSLGRQILGIGMMVLGTAVSIGSTVAGLIYPPGFFAGVGLGISLIAGGVATYLSGRSHGLHQSLTVYGSATKGCTFFESAPSAPPPELPQQSPTPQNQVANSGLYPDVGQLYPDGSIADNIPRSQFSI